MQFLAKFKRFFQIKFITPKIKSYTSLLTSVIVRTLSQINCNAIIVLFIIFI